MNAEAAQSLRRRVIAAILNDARDHPEYSAYIVVQAMTEVGIKPEYITDAAVTIAEVQWDQGKRSIAQ